MRTKTQKTQGNMAFGFGRSETISSGQRSLLNKKIVRKKQNNALLQSHDRMSSNSSWKQAFTMRTAGMGIADVNMLRKGSDSFNEKFQHMNSELSAQARIRDNGFNPMEEP